MGYVGHVSHVSLYSTFISLFSPPHLPTSPPPFYLYPSPFSVLTHPIPSLSLSPSRSSSSIPSAPSSLSLPFFFFIARFRLQRLAEKAENRTIYFQIFPLSIEITLCYSLASAVFLKIYYQVQALGALLGPGRGLEVVKC
ncbi:uncharacterized protein LOC114310162 isoform X2 [Camellia sinensis]|uniref:uncharacterized protein LOC114310162 isoform X2 n=1 Tax=Camellia sinensis TaxID=4442 RepID=UPI001036851B|nr:uncharacterized protein LOC114310162 isoform X2 [Camellia sinensis]